MEIRNCSSAAKGPFIKYVTHYGGGGRGGVKHSGFLISRHYKSIKCFGKSNFRAKFQGNADETYGKHFSSDTTFLRWRGEVSRLTVRVYLGRGSKYQ